MDSTPATANLSNQNGEEKDEFVDNTDDKVCVYETLISRGYIKQELYDTEDEQESTYTHVKIKDEYMQDTKVLIQETVLMTDTRENYRCDQCGENYDLYCLKCPMLIRIFNNSGLKSRDNKARHTLPNKFIDIFETSSGLGIVALRSIPKGVVFGPFEGLDSTKDGTVSKWRLKNKELSYAKDLKQLNWMQYIRRTDQNSHQNLIPFQCEDRLYFRSDCFIHVNDELLICWGSGNEERGIQDVGDSYWTPQVCERLDDTYACTFCCIGYKSICHLAAHNSRCPEKRNPNDFCKEIIQCALCKIYLDQKEYSDHHIDRCCKSNPKCGFKTCYKKYLEHHLRYHEDLKSIKCKRCDIEFFNRQLYVQHNKEEHALKQHVTIHSVRKPFACTLCSYKTNIKSALKRHVTFHSDDKPFACTLCSYKTNMKSALKRHVAIHSDDKPFGCTLCAYKTNIKSALKQHAAIHSDDKPFGCTLCAYKTNTKSALKQHVVFHSDDKPFACTLCPYKTKQSSNLKMHVATHNDDKRFACTVCPYKTALKSALKKHVVIHNDDKPFACTLCPYKTNQSWNLKIHVATHNDDKQFTCTVCPYKTALKSALKRHVVVHNDDKPFACTQCSFKARAKWILKVHVAIHNVDKPFVCTLCPYKTTRNADLKKHIARHSDD